MDLLINPTFADEADIEFINPMAEYFPSPPPPPPPPPPPEPTVHPPCGSDSDTNLF